MYIALGLLISLQPPFYPSEAEAMGASPAEYGFVFGIANLSLFIFRKELNELGPSAKSRAPNRKNAAAYNDEILLCGV